MTTGASLTGSVSVRKLQTVLHAKAKEEPGRRFHALVDKAWREDFLLAAWGWSGATAERLEWMVKWSGMSRRTEWSAGSGNCRGT